MQRSREGRGTVSREGSESPFRLRSSNRNIRTDARRGGGAWPLNCRKFSLQTQAEVFLVTLRGCLCRNMVKEENDVHESLIIKVRQPLGRLEFSVIAERVFDSTGITFRNYVNMKFRSMLDHDRQILFMVLQTYQRTSRMSLLRATPRLVGLASQAPRSTGWLAIMPTEGEAGRKWSKYLRVTERSCCFR